MDRENLTDISKMSVEEFEEKIQVVIDPNQGGDFWKEFYNAFVFPKRVGLEEGLNRFVDMFQTFREIDRKLAICYPSLETRKGLLVTRHRFPMLRHHVRLSLSTGFRIKPEHGYYHLKEEVVFHEKKNCFYVAPGELKTESEIVDFLTRLFDRLSE